MSIFFAPCNYIKSFFEQKPNVLQIEEDDLNDDGGPCIIGRMIESVVDCTENTINKISISKFSPCAAMKKLSQCLGQLKERVCVLFKRTTANKTSKNEKYKKNELMSERDIKRKANKRKHLSEVFDDQDINKEAITSYLHDVEQNFKACEPTKEKNNILALLSQRSNTALNFARALFVTMDYTFDGSFMKKFLLNKDISHTNFALIILAIERKKNKTTKPSEALKWYMVECWVKKYMHMTFKNRLTAIPNPSEEQQASILKQENQIQKYSIIIDHILENPYENAYNQVYDLCYDHEKIHLEFDLEELKKIDASGELLSEDNTTDNDPSDTNYMENGTTRIIADTVRFL